MILPRSRGAGTARRERTMRSAIASTFQVPLLVVALWVLVFTPAALAGGVLNPATHTSPSGRYSLHVDPTAMNGAGPAQYRMTRDGQEVWAGERPFSLWDAGVTDDGIVAGYAYEGGVGSGGHHGTRYDSLAIYILDADGNTLARDTPAHHDSDVMINSWAARTARMSAG